MDKIDSEILNIIQSDFPLDSHPYAVLAERLGVKEDEILYRVSSLKESGIIRKIGASFNTKLLGHSSILVATKVPSDRLDAVAELVSSFSEVTHNYGRDGEYNLWFAIVCSSTTALDETLSKIRSATGIQEMHPLPAEKMFKIKVEFEF
ncbi:MAG: siroheme decarboxylase subunit alpha [Armatimonadota bacterium]